MTRCPETFVHVSRGLYDLQKRTTCDFVYTPLLRGVSYTALKRVIRQSRRLLHNDVVVLLSVISVCRGNLSGASQHLDSRQAPL